MRSIRAILGSALVLWGALATSARSESPAERAAALARQLGATRGICLLLGENAAVQAAAFAGQTEFTIFVQVPAGEATEAARAALELQGLLGTRVWVSEGTGSRIHLASDLVDVAVLDGEVTDALRAECRRVLRPGGLAWESGTLFEKPFPAGTDDWRHPYHGPDNNPQSADQVARRPFQTHFLAEPWYCPLPQQTVIAGGRIFKAFGNRSSARPQEEWLNTLLAVNAFNGAILWRRPLAPDFMIHRNTLVATPGELFLGDATACHVLDASTGQEKRSLVAPANLVDGPVWKWMALEGNVLYALVGEREGSDATLRGANPRGAGWPWWKIEKYAFGFGRTLLAFNATTGELLWHYRSEHPLDSRGTCLKGKRLYTYSEGKQLSALNTETGQVVWQTSSPELLAALGDTGPAQHWMLGFASTAYLKCSDEALYFAGPQRKNLVAVAAATGKLLWQHAGGNVQLVLRSEGVYALGEGHVNSVASSRKIHPLTGAVLAEFPSRDRCTRATGCLDTIFTRGGAGGSTALFDVTSEQPTVGLVTPMRPACQDGVVVAHGYLFWGPWQCRCDLTQLGLISLGSQSREAVPSAAEEAAAPAAQAAEAAVAPPPPFNASAQDWPTYRADNRRSTRVEVKVPREVKPLWHYRPPATLTPTAPLAAGGLAIVGGSDGVVRAIDLASGQLRYRAFTGGPMKYPPAVEGNRLFAGSGDGYVYCWAAATGKRLWRFRAAPAERVIPVYGALASTWPVGSGVLVEGGTVYAAAGMSNFDGTHVYALDAVSSALKWHNSTSGNHHNSLAQGGVSVQGPLLLHNNSVYLPAGNKPTVAAFAVNDGALRLAGSGRGKDLFLRGGEVKAAGFPLYWRPADDHFLSAMEFELPGGLLAVNTGSLALYPPGTVLPAGGSHRDAPAAGGAQAPPAAKPEWSVRPCEETAAVAILSDAVLVTGVNWRPGPERVAEAQLLAFNLSDGKPLWRLPLPANPAGWGLAVDSQGRIVVALVDGSVLGFGKP